MGTRVVRTSQNKVSNVTNLGLRWDRFCPFPGKTVEHNAERLLFLDSFESIAPDALDAYRIAFACRRELLESRGGAFAEWQATDRVCFGAGDKGVLEVGIRFHRTYGVPIIPGSAQKGLVLRTMKRMTLSDEERGRTTDRMLGKGGDRGWAAAVAFHDALWMPDSKRGPFVTDTITVHHREYYGGGDAPADWDSPNPISTLAATGTFLFAVEGTPGATRLALRLLGTALRDEGIGSRTLKGYGRFIVNADDAFPANNSSKQLFANHAPMAPVILTSQHVAERARLIFQPNTGRFQVILVHDGKEFKVLTTVSPLELFPGDSDAARGTTMNTMQQRCRKKGEVVVRVEYTIREASFAITVIQAVQP